MSATPEVKKTGIHRKSTNSKSSKSSATVDHSLHSTPKPLKTLGSKFSAPSGKVRKSSARADHCFQALKLYFWFSGYSTVVDFVGGESHRVQHATQSRRTRASRVRPRASQADNGPSTGLSLPSATRNPILSNRQCASCVPPCRD